MGKWEEVAQLTEKRFGQGKKGTRKGKRGRGKNGRKILLDLNMLDLYFEMDLYVERLSSIYHTRFI